MNSPTHSLLALAVLTKSGPENRARNWAVFIGSLLPDAAVWLWWPWQTLVKNEPQRRIWDELYFEPQMQLIIAPFNSAPLLTLIAVVGWIFRKTKLGLIALMGALAGLIHIATDIPVHSHDAYRHFWPLSDWRFHSPLSYYEADKHAAWVSSLEGLLAIICIVVLWRRFTVDWVRIMLMIITVLYVFLLVVAPIIAPLIFNG